ncbi:amidohydrolase [Phenylobacterium sp.]|uniref:amidohydrolase n=1 Tax=Phenylobacterium sp. TaxID=1871053 RepID=UPI003783EF5E
MIARREVLTRAAAFALAGAASGQAVAAQPSGAPADLLLVNGKVATMDPALPRAEAVLVRRGRIAYVGSNAGARQRAGGLKPIDLEGRTLLPGFIEGHTHFEWYVESDAFHTRVPQSLGSLPEIFEVLQSAAAKTPKGEWIFGRGYFGLERQVAEKRLATRQELDAITTDHPMILFSSVHVASLNTPALKKLGFWTPEDERKLRWKDGTQRTGTMVGRDAQGLPTGVVTEMFDLVLDESTIPLAARKDAYERYAQEAFLGTGMTTVCNVSGVAEHIRVERQMQREGRLPLRFRTFYIVPAAIGLDDMIKQGLTQGQGDAMHRVGGVKMFVDGAGQDPEGNRISDFKWTEARLTEHVAKANAAGLPVLLHAVSVPGLERSLNAIAGARAQTGRAMRNQIHHVGFLSDPAHLRRLRDLGITVGITRAEKGNGRLPQRRADFRAMFDTGVQVLCVADPAGSFKHFSTWEGIGSLVAPVSEGGVLPDDRRITVDEALRTWTTQSALTNYEERDKGSISVGKLADFQVISQDPWQVAPGALFDTKVQEVFLAGRSVYRRA